MVPITDQPKVAGFFKVAFAIDGEVEFLDYNAVRGLIHTHALSVMRLTDSKRGVFYVGTFKPKVVNTTQAQTNANMSIGQTDF